MASVLMRFRKNTLLKKQSKAKLNHHVPAVFVCVAPNPATQLQATLIKRKGLEECPRIEGR